MTAFLHPRQFSRSLRFAWRGLHHALKHEQNFRLQLVVGLVAVVAGVLLGLSSLRLVMVVLLTTMVLVLELLNTFFEKLIDVIHPRVHHYAEVMKDLLAASVLVASIGSVIVGLMLFWPYLWPLVVV